MSDCFLHNSLKLAGTDSDPLAGISLDAAELTAEAAHLLRSLTLSIAESEDFNAALAVLLRQVCGLTDWGLGEVWVPDPEREVLGCSPIWFAKDPQRLQAFRQATESITCAWGVGLPGRVWQSQQPEWVTDVSQPSDQLFLRLDAALQVGLRAGFGVPILAQEQVLAVLVFFMFEPRQQDRQLVALVVAIASQLGIVMQLKRTEAALSASQRRLASLIDSLPGIVFTADSDVHWSMNYLSEGCYGLTGYHGYELAGEDRIITYNEITHPDDLPSVLDAISEAIAQHRLYVVEYRIRTRLGEEKWLWEKGYGIYDGQGQVVGLEGFITDISSLKQTQQVEAALQKSEEKFRKLFENAAIGIGTTTADGRLSVVNPTLQRLLGYSAEQIASIAIADITHPDDLGLDLALYDELLAGKRTFYQLEKRYIRKDGQIFWGRLTVSAMPGVPGDPSVAFGMVEDITERKQAERAIQEKEAFLRLILDNIPQYIFWKDRNLVYQGANQIFIESAGLSKLEDLVGKTDYDLWHLEQAQSYWETDQELMATDTPKLHAIRSKVQAGQQTIWQDVSKVPIHDADGNVIGILGAYEDITERRRVEEAAVKREQYLAMLVDVQRCLLTFDDREAVYQTVLASLGKLAEANRVYLFEHRCQEPQGGQMNQRYIWCGAGFDLPIGHAGWQKLFYRRVSLHIWQRLSAGDVYGGIVAQLPEPERSLLSSQGVLSVLLLPLLVKGELVGFLGFENCVEARTWEALEVDLLRAAAAAISLSLEHQQAEAALRKSEGRYRLLAENLQQAEAKYRGIFENAVEGIFQSTPEGQYLTVNPMLARLYGYDSPDEVIAQLTDIQRQLYVVPERRAEFVRQMQGQGAVWGFESEVYRKDGSVIWISECARALYDAEGKLIGYEGTVEDITRRKQAEAELIKRDNLLLGMAEATNYLLTNPDFSVAIPQAIAILGKAASVDRVYIYENHPHPESGDVAMSMRYEWVRETIQPSIAQPHWQNQSYTTPGFNRWYDRFIQGKSVSGIVRNLSYVEQHTLRKDDIQSIIMVPIFIDDEFWGLIGFDDCQQERLWSSSEESILVAIAASIGGAIKRQRTEEQMRYQAFHDALTGLPNRMLYNHRLNLALARARRTGERFGVLFLDLDRFKTINDTLGHAIGDLLLKQATDRLTQCLREQDIIARWGGDEFTLLLPDLKSPEAAVKIAQRISDVLKPMFYLEGHELHITSSIGIALYPDNGKDAQTLLKNADAALYRAKEQGRNNYQFYTAAINSQASERLTLDSSLHHALERNEFVIYYQPQIDILTGEITQMEALIRWQHPQLGLVSPQTFISLAEENGLIVPIGEWVLRTACAQNWQWQAAGLAPLRVAVNLSARQFQQPNLVEQVATILAETGLLPHHLELEITETAAMRDVDFTRSILQELRSMGVRIALDDFGTGYSSLGYLKKFPLHALKIDRSFIQDLTENSDDTAIISAITTLGKGLNLSVVAEGVETIEQMEKLRSLNCQEMQGYLFSQPLDACLATEFLRQNQIKTRLEKNYRETPRLM